MRRRGSHVILGHQSGSGRLVIPVHPGKTMKLGTLSGILEDAGTGEDLRELL
ncbi:MAG: type II toxin-antitoxin system HicA family toxin [Chloroflexota bacterium]